MNSLKNKYLIIDLLLNDEYLCLYDLVNFSKLPHDLVKNLINNLIKNKWIEYIDGRGYHLIRKPQESY